MIFEEKQSMKQLWWVLLPLPIILVVVITMWLREGEPAEKTEIFSSLLLLLCIEALIFLLFAAMRLYGRIDKNGVSFRYTPFIKQRSYAWDDISKVWVRKYKPIAEYGGWGIKSVNLKNKGIAYNVWGNKGLQLELKSGKKVLIGTQKPEEMAAFLKRLKEKYNLMQIEDPQLNG